MLVDTSNLVSRDDLVRDLDRYVAAAAAGHGPVAVTQDSRVIGFLVSPKDYEALHGESVAALLKSRMSGETVPHEVVRSRTESRALLE